VSAGWFADDCLLSVPLHSVFSLCVQISLFYEPALVGQLCPLKLFVEVLISSTSECDLWRQRLYRGNQVKMRSLGVAPHPGFLIKREDLDRDTHSRKM